MHIIKISPVSFKIILTKEDLTRHGVENILHHTELCGDFFEEIIRETTLRFENPFRDGAIDAEFFESKDGGGELFITRGKRKSKNATYLLSCGDIERIFSLCQALYDSSFKPYKSRLFYDGENYQLLLTYKNDDSFISSFLKEYGNVSQANKLQIWVIEEHSKPLIKENAVGTISGFLSRYTKAKDTPL